MNGLFKHNGRGLFAVVVFTAALPFVWVGLFAGDDFLIRFFPDDAFYYLETAWNFTHIGRVSFDGVNSTNGFHPLFFLVSALGTLLFPHHYMLNGFFLLRLVLIFAAIILCLKKTDDFLGRRNSILLFPVLTLPLFFSYNWISCGMEAGLVIMATVFFFWSWVRAESHNFTDQRRNLLLGAAITLLILSRLDLILVLLPFVLFIFRRLLQKGSALRLQHALGIFILPLVFGGLYLRLNVVATGHLVPVSGVAKRLLAEPSRGAWEDFISAGWLGCTRALLPLFGSLAVFIGAAVPRLRKRLAPLPLHAILLLNAGLVIFYLYLYFYAFFALQYFFWYFSFPEAVLLVTAALLLGNMLPQTMLEGPRRRYWAWLLGFALLFNVTANSYFLFRLVPWEENTSYHLLHVAREVDRICGPEAVIGSFDSGTVGFFTKGRVINLDGLANNFDYLENYLVTQNIKEYLSEQGVSHLLVAGEHLVNRRMVRRGDYQEARFQKDLSIHLPREKELYRYKVPGWCTLYLYRLGS